MFASTVPARRWGGRRIVWCGFALALSALPATAPAQEHQKRVLVLHSTGNDSALADVADRMLPRLLDQGLSQRLDFYSEDIDAGQFSTPQYQAALVEFLKLKYRDEEPAIVIAFRDPATAFIHRFRDQLFPNAALVYFTRNPDTPRPRNSTGIVAPFDLGRTVELETPSTRPERSLRHLRCSGTRRGVRTSGAIGAAPVRTGAEVHLSGGIDQRSSRTTTVDAP